MNYLPFFYLATWQNLACRQCRGGREKILSTMYIILKIPTNSNQVPLARTLTRPETPALPGTKPGVNVMITIFCDFRQKNRSFFQKSIL
jgi:hypothetical protein